VVPALTWQAWLTPPPIGSKTVLRDQEAMAGLVFFHTGDLTGFEVGSGPLVLALHGWGGRAAQMAPLAQRLAEEGFRVVVPDLPGRAGGEPTDIKQIAASVRGLVDEIGLPDIVVAHSFASLMMRVAFAEEAPRSVVWIAPALDASDALEVFSDRLRLFPWARRGLRRRLVDFDPVLWPRVSSLPVGDMPGTQVLLIHDPADDETPFARSAELAALRTDTSIVVADGLGHSRILSDARVLDRVAEFAGRKLSLTRSPG
jgi:pimeloyl-ACP methyl ester carboxylesterase